jgi:hypothetical protein
MLSKSLLGIAGLIATASPATAAQAPTKGQPQAQEKIYCLQLEPFTGSRLSRTGCKTKKQWALVGIDVDELLAK